MAALFGGVNSPRPHPDDAEKDEESGCRGSERTQQRQPAGHGGHTSDGERPCAEPISQAPGHRSGDPEGERHGHQFEAGPARTELQAALQIEGHQEQNTEHDQVRQQAAGDARR